VAAHRSHQSALNSVPHSHHAVVTARQQPGGWNNDTSDRSNQNRCRRVVVGVRVRVDVRVGVRVDSRAAATDLVPCESMASTVTASGWSLSDSLMRPVRSKRHTRELRHADAMTRQSVLTTTLDT
jgi:hypothetical protein